VACSAPRERFGDPQAEITAMLTRSAGDWNHGDLAGFMGDYVKDSLTSYVSGGHVQYGWQPLFDHYQAAYFAPGKARDSLSFDEVHVRPLTPDLALATARFALYVTSARPCAMSANEIAMALASTAPATTASARRYPRRTRRVAIMGCACRSRCLRLLASSLEAATLCEG
jgi:hypothetical protein